MDWGWFAKADTWLGLAGIGVGVFGVLDARRERSRREKAVIAARAVIERTYGILETLKPSLGAQYTAVINDGLAFINQERPKLEKL